MSQGHSVPVVKYNRVKMLQNLNVTGLNCYSSKMSQQIMYQRGRVWTSRPAKKGGRSVRRKKNSNADMPM
jgi:hypothetical protein